ncbi:hypothetical protein [Jiangella asiatica]|uniref:Uncharacterized protein n=1 Tax=Jiangella asiatica TaxID=2530372 RepID=A0A4R5CXZ3_9ACTN|nr:hypothetical protein [Jiangella asiatica]TDE02815.1 hypothetical protein E1269_21220 [Jiangella asiatica]
MAPPDYVERVDAVHAELWSLLAPQTAYERKIVAWMRVGLDLSTLEPLRNMVARARSREDG